MAKHHNHTTLSGFRSLTYISWTSMMNRCKAENVEKRKYYSDRGIVVCERWKDFRLFLEDMGERPSKIYTLDRFPNKTGNYEPGNVRWADKTEQANNITNNILITYKGITKTLPMWCKELKLSYHRIIHRIFDKGLTPEQAFELPKRSASFYARKKQSILLWFKGELKSLKEWTDELGIDYESTRRKIRDKAWSVEKAFTGIDRQSNFISHSFGINN